MPEFEETPTWPYIGPSPFEAKHQSIFFGRDLEANALFSLLIAERIVLFYAQSGAGKSSLVNAKIIPELQKEYVVLRTRVGLDAGDVKEHVSNVFVYSALSSLPESTNTDQGYARSQLLYYREWISAEDVSKRRWLIFDQFEEIITTNQDRWEHRRVFFEQLAMALEHDPLLSVLFVIRSDYIAGLDLYSDILPNKLRTRFYMELLKRPAAFESIQKPAEIVGCDFTKSAAGTLVEKLCLVNTPDGEKPGEYVEPVLLQVACRELWDQLKDKSIVTNDDVKDFKVEDALKHFYEDAIHVEEIKRRVSEEVLRRWFSEKLIVPPGIRGQVKRDEPRSGDLDTKIADRLVNSHLLRSEFSRGATWFELAHDRLVKPIVTSNTAWSSENENIYERLARAWQESEYSEELLLKSFDLSQAEEWAKQQREGIGNGVKTFFERSRASDDKRRADALAKENADIRADALKERMTLLETAKADRLELQRLAEAQKAQLEKESKELQQRLLRARRRFKLLRLILVAGICVGAFVLSFLIFGFVQTKNATKRLELSAQDEQAKAQAQQVIAKEDVNNARRRVALVQKIFPIQSNLDKFFEQAEAADRAITELLDAHRSEEKINVGLPEKRQELSPPKSILIMSRDSRIVISDLPKKNELQSDSIFYQGEKASPENEWKYQYIALLMLRAGLPVKVIMRTVSTQAKRDRQIAEGKSDGLKEAIGVTGADWGTNQIVVGTNQDLFKLTCSLTVEEVKDPKKWGSCYDTRQHAASIRPTKVSRAK